MNNIIIKPINTNKTENELKIIENFARGTDILWPPNQSLKYTEDP